MSTSSTSKSSLEAKRNALDIDVDAAFKNSKYKKRSSLIAEPLIYGNLLDNIDKSDKINEKNQSTSSIVSLADSTLSRRSSVSDINHRTIMGTVRMNLQTSQSLEEIDRDLGDRSNEAAKSCEIAAKR